MKKLSYVMLLLFVAATKVGGQVKLDSLLVSVAKNNKTILATTQFWEAKKLEYQTGLTLSNPKIDYDYMKGSPENAGNQTDFTVTQAFDFPTVYIKKRQLAEEQIAQAEFQLNANRQAVLLAAKLVCIELIYRNKVNAELKTRKQNVEKLQVAFENSLSQGHGNVMDINKAKLQAVEVNAALQENTSLINQLSQQLIELNGGMPIQFLETTYPPQFLLPDFETLEQEIKAQDPIRKYLEQEKVVGENEVSLSKSLSLPKLEAGYHYQAILGQQFSGVHVGLTIPLWENKNTVKAKQAELLLNEAEMQGHMNKQYHEIKQVYERMLNLKITLDEYEKLFATLNNVELLDKSLAAGQISTIEYFMEMTYYYDALKNYLKTEMEYNKVVAELFKYQL